MIRISFHHTRMLLIELIQSSYKANLWKERLNGSNDDIKNQHMVSKITNESLWAGKNTVEKAFLNLTLNISVVSLVLFVFLDLLLNQYTLTLPSNLTIIAVLVCVKHFINRLSFQSIAVALILSLDLIMLYRGIVLIDLFTLTSVVILIMGLTCSITLTGKARRVVHCFNFATLLAIISVFPLNESPGSILTFLLFFRNHVPLLLFYFLISASTEVFKDKYEKQKKEMLKLNQMLDEKNKLIKARNENLCHDHEKMESLVRLKTLRLEEKNKQLKELSYANAHKVRGPLARILGLLNLIAVDPCDKDIYICKIHSEAIAMDQIIKMVGVTIESHIDYDKIGS